MSEDITELVLRFREAMRHLWNSHAYSLDGEHRFNAIETDYFYFSVLFQTESRVSNLRDSEQYYYKHVAVRPIFSELSLQVLIGKRNNTGVMTMHGLPLKKMMIWSFATLISPI